MDQNLSDPLPTTPLAPEDYYLEASKMVFTAAYHLIARQLLRLGLPSLPIWGCGERCTGDCR
jgi:hypothetical protein